MGFILGVFWLICPILVRASSMTSRKSLAAPLKTSIEYEMMRGCCSENVFRPLVFYCKQPLKFTLFQPQSLTTLYMYSVCHWLKSSGRPEMAASYTSLRKTRLLYSVPFPSDRSPESPPHVIQIISRIRSAKECTITCDQYYYCYLALSVGIQVVFRWYSCICINERESIQGEVKTSEIWEKMAHCLPMGGTYCGQFVDVSQYILWLCLCDVVGPRRSIVGRLFYLWVGCPNISNHSPPASLVLP